VALPVVTADHRRVNGKKLVFFGGGDGFCYAFEALKEPPAEPTHFKKVWSYDCDPPELP